MQEERKVPVVGVSGIDIAETSFKSALESKAQASLSRQRDRKARSSLLAVLQDMNAQLDADEENEVLAGERGLLRTYGDALARGVQKKLGRKSAPCTRRKNSTTTRTKRMPKYHQNRHGHCCK
jgi:hypothetical protein